MKTRSVTAFLAAICAGGACNALTGADRFGVGEILDAAPDQTMSEDAEADDAITPRDATVVKDAAAPDACVPCADQTCCNGQVCRANTCGACSPAGSPCESHDDCCDSLVCSSDGKCVAQCSDPGGACPCCIGNRCGQFPFIFCNACKIANAPCDATADCCSQVCTNGKCVGSVTAK